METSLAESQTDSYFPTKWPNGYPNKKDVSDKPLMTFIFSSLKPTKRNIRSTVPGHVTIRVPYFGSQY